MLSVFLLLSVLAAAPLGSRVVGAVVPARPVAAGPLEAALRLLRRWTDQGRVTEPDEIARAERALVDLDLGWIAHEDRRVEIQLVLLDFLGRTIRVAEGEGAKGDDLPGRLLPVARGEEDLRRRTRSLLRRRLPEIEPWLTREVLLLERAHPPDRRVAACEVLAEQEGEEVLLALFSGTRSSPEAVRDAAVAALCGRDVPVVHVRLVELLDLADQGRLAVRRGAIERHFAEASIPAAERETVERIGEYVESALASEDWRRASRGVTVCHCLPHPAAFPALIGGMQTWLARSDGERPVRRVLGEIEAELRRRSGRSLGLHPTRWIALWEGHQRGEISLTGQGEEPGMVTRADFFGLRPATDRVVFVLDRSGSMETEFGGKSHHSRLEEASARLTAFLEQLGPETRFTVVAFSDRATRWHVGLRDATPGNIKSAATWVLHAGARGGTNLRAGVLAAMHVDSAGRIDLDALEADTVIVLCDGQTMDGPAWVAPLLRRVNDEARLVFHAVQIGSGGDGTLQALCELTGGDFVRVDG